MRLYKRPIPARTPNAHRRTPRHSSCRLSGARFPHRNRPSRFVLEPQATRVTAKLEIVRKRAGASLVLQGEDLKLISLALDGKELADSAYQLDARSLIIPMSPTASFWKAWVDRARRQYRAGRPLQVRRHVLHPMRARGLPPHHLVLDRPDNLSVFTVRIEAAKEQYPVLLSNGNRIAAGRVGRRPPFCVLA